MNISTLKYAYFIIFPTDINKIKLKSKICKLDQNTKIDGETKNFLLKGKPYWDVGKEKKIMRKKKKQQQKETEMDFDLNGSNLDLLMTVSDSTSLERDDAALIGDEGIGTWCEWDNKSSREFNFWDIVWKRWKYGAGRIFCSEEFMYSLNEKDHYLNRISYGLH